MDALRTLETPIISRTPLIANETLEGERVEQPVVAALYTAFARGAQLSIEHILEEVKDPREWARNRAVPAS